MKTLILSASTLAILMTTLSFIPVAQSQDPVSQPTASTVVVDINYLFKNHPNFNRQMQQMQSEVDAFENVLAQKRTELENLQELMGTFDVGTNEYRDVEQQMARIAADVNVQTTVRRNEFRNREALIYYETYEEISGIIRQFAQQRGISLVLRFNSEQVDPNNPDDVLRGVNRAVVVQQNLNITYEILNIINQQHANSQPGHQPRQ